MCMRTSAGVFCCCLAKNEIPAEKWLSIDTPQPLITEWLCTRQNTVVRNFLTSQIGTRQIVYIRTSECRQSVWTPSGLLDNSKPLCTGEYITLCYQRLRSINRQPFLHRNFHFQQGSNRTHLLMSSYTSISLLIVSMLFLIASYCSLYQQSSYHIALGIRFLLEFEDDVVTIIEWGHC